MTVETNTNEATDLNTDDTNTELENIEATVESNGELGVETLLTETEEILSSETETSEVTEDETSAPASLDGDSLESFLTENAVEGEDTSENTTEENIEAVMTDLNTPTAPVTPAVSTRLPFADRAESMGLTVMEGRTYHYADRFSEVAYKIVKTQEGSGIVDDTEIPHLVLYTKGLEEDAEWSYQAFISDAYKFIGNDVLVSDIIASIAEVGNPAIQENNLMSFNNTEMRHEIIIMNGTDVPDVGSILPMMQISNTYNGTGASMITFGLTIIEADGETSSLSAEKFGKIRQIHITGSQTELSAALGSYITIFNENIGSVITNSFNQQVTIEEMMELLDTIEKKVGKKRREAIAATLPTTPEAGTTWNLNAWQLFLALTRFTSVEKNINSKKVLESVVETVLVLPAEMIESLKTINV